ncbi:MAG: sigma 54-interacting transcriptional regulator, partial [Spongiibacter sp.]
MQHIATDADLDFSSLLDSLDYPAILLSPEYRILASNKRYLDSFGDVPQGDYCYRVSHGYDRPCDQAGESCPLQACTRSGQRERVLHIHNTPRGREHIDVEMLPLTDRHGKLRYFIEVLKPVKSASAEISSSQMVGRSAAFNTMLELINLVAPHETSVLLLGESGAGKELAAQAIHGTSRRADSAMVTVECAGLTETLFESELFGHVKGAFTGAVSNKPGLLESARGGTLFLDEIGDVPLGMQVKLLRLLETGSYRAVGSTQPKLADFRLVSATNKDLPGMIARGEFREDLYYRINAFPIHLPPLRERREDIALLSRSILKKLSPNGGYRLTDSAVKRLQQREFPGNI